MDSATDSNKLDVLLSGYSYAEWPDLSGERSPFGSRTHTASKHILLPETAAPAIGSVSKSIVILATAQVVGAYCGISDVLLAVQAPDGAIGMVRITWGGEDRWEEVILDVESALQEAFEHPLSLHVAREALSLNKSQYPYLAVCRFNEQHVLEEPLPPVFSYHNSELNLSASLSSIHPQVSIQIIAQVSELIRHAYDSPSSKFTSLPPLPTEILSICKRGTDDDVISAYPHLFPAPFAPDYLARRAEDMPYGIAVQWYSELSLDASEFRYERTSYAQLHRKSNQVARWLLRLGIQPEDRVAVCLERDLDFHASMIGIMRAGGCYVPIDPELPLERKTYIAKDASAAFVLTSSEIVTADVFGSITLYIDDEARRAEILKEGDDDLKCMKSENLAYLLYTSGTTGNPKGCLLTHRGLAQTILALSSSAADVRLDDIHDGRYLAVASIAFDVHLAETFVPIALGMPLLSARRSQLLEHLPSYVNKLGVTHLGIVPSLIEATLNAAQGDIEGNEMALKYIASGGEKMSDSILDKWADHPQIRLANFYGPSEVTIGCCARYMSSTTPRSNIGRPFANVSAYVVDSGMHILLRGAIGELVVEGPLVGRGYHGRPDLTANVFLNWPRKDCWAYRTGDLVRMMPDSSIEILGRIDTQIKLRGVRIESEGISAIIRRAVPSSDAFNVDATTILAKHPAINVDQLVSFITWDKPLPVSVRNSKRPYISVPPMGLLKEMKATCESELPAYMRPSHFIPLSWLPLSSNGKTDTKLLADLFKNLSLEEIAKLSISPAGENLSQCTEIEMKLVDVLRNHLTLPLDNPHPGINVFECGLDSIGVIKFTSALKDAFKIKITPSQVMKTPRISDIAFHLTATKPHKRQPPLDLDTYSIKALHSIYNVNHVEAVLPSFAIQEGVLSRSADVDTLYVQHVLINCKTDISISRLRQAWEWVAERQQILRTVFHFGRTLHQVVLKSESCSLNWESKETAVLPDSESFRQFFLSREAPAIARKINQSISTAPPYQLSVYPSEKQNFVALSIHHALFDGISLPQLFLQVERHYLGFSSCPDTPASEILQYISAIDLDEAEKFWREYFDGFTWPRALLLSQPSQSTNRMVLDFKIPLSTLKKSSSLHQVTVQALFTCAFAHLLARNVYRRKDVVFGVLRSGRLLPVDRIEEAILPLVAILPVRVCFEYPQVSLQTIQEGISSTIEYEHLPLGKMQGWIRPGNPLFDILFSVSVNVLPESNVWDVIESEPPEADYPLAVEVVLNPRTDSILVQAAWITESPPNWLHELEDVVHSLAVNPTLYLSQSLDDLSYTASGLDCFNGTQESKSENDKIADANPMILRILQTTVSNFFGFDPTIVTASTSLISMGLDSIKSVGLAKAITKEGLPVTSTEILRNSTLQQLANHINAKNSHLDDDQIQPVNGVHPDVLAEIHAVHVKLLDHDIVEFFPTTALQAGMLSQTVSSKGELYVHAFPLPMPDFVDADRLFWAWSKVVASFSILRTSFHFATESGIWVQAVHSEATLDWSEVSVDSDNSEIYKLELQSFLGSIKIEDETSFNQPPRWLRLFTFHDGSSRLVLVMHHALYDGISVGKLSHALDAFYRDLPVIVSTQFHDLLPHFLHQEKAGITYWLKRMRIYKPIRLPRLHPFSLSTAATVKRFVSLDPLKVKEILNQASVTMQCICQAALAKVLSAYTREADVVFGHTVSGRSIPGAENVIGPVLNTIPCCVRLEANMSNIDLLRFIHQGNLDGLLWQQASVRAIQKALGVDSLWDSLFLFQPAQLSEIDESPNWTFEEKAAISEVKIQYPLNVEMLHHDSGITVKCASRPDYIGQLDLNVIAEELHKSIQHILCDPYGRVTDDISRFPRNATFSYNSEEDMMEHLPKIGSRTDLTASVDSFGFQSILVALTGAPISSIKPETPLVALGIDSIMAIQIVGKFRKAGVKITASDVVSSRTVGDMLSKVKSLESGSIVETIATKEIPDEEKAAICLQLGINAEKVESICHASSGMKWLIGAWQKSLGTRFHPVFAYRLPDETDVTRMQAAWSSLVQRHPVLRSTFACPRGYETPRLVVFKTVDKSWSEEYVAEDTMILPWMKALLSNPAPVSSPPARALLLRSSRHLYFILHLHHFQYDAWSLQLLIYELSCLYRNSQAAVSNKLQKFLDYYGPSPEHLTQQRHYWQSCFVSGFKPSLFPTLKLNTTPQLVQRIVRTNTASIPDASKCAEQARSLGVSLNSVFLACWAIIQGQMSSSPSSTFGLWHSGRTGGMEDVANLAFPCMNVLPMHIPAVDEKDVLGIVKRVQRDLHRRTSVIQQSDLVLVHGWVGFENTPICNVFINIVKVAIDASFSDPLLQPIDAPYFVPDQVDFDRSSMDKLAITQLIQDDLMIDIAVIDRSDSVMMSIDASASMMDEIQADSLICRWADSVQAALGLR
ncbi:hypothetical protein GALMADRAFT_59971 [Galerina marginata CBS 339.88]|uniref:Carrier domain-containing protein n=1 Tax=Galerina marginata (strain CBS 339.88) TaxID=685588 RepID=A0A067TP17_GALM3|nr:hypothetical protein GALMADRAFT_59971 [Galerina marginata CBS 339.88]